MSFRDAPKERYRVLVRRPDPARVITIEGRRRLVREFSTWGGVSRFAWVAPEA